ncbi:MAG: hypothetical protein LLG06_15390 [Desulfobacteraceae bacterium]|nr:hypothetical protein [Desulfobacteraceae bacterium]
MTESFIHNVPASMASGHGDSNLIIRSRDPSELAECLCSGNLQRICHVQVTGLDSEPDPLVEKGPGVPVDLVVGNPLEELPLLYRWTPLLTNHPVRATIPVAAGFSKAVKLAVALNFAVKLDVLQPGPPLVEELHRVLHAYLHQTAVTQPVEYFHSLLLAFYRRERLTLWTVQEEDPGLYRHVTDDGLVTPGRRFKVPDGSGYFVPEPGFVIRECESARCEHIEHCAGYFRLPAREYDCEGVKSLFRVLKGAAEDLRSDLDSYDSGSPKAR